MPPKKKGTKHQEEDWEAELGEAAPGTESPAGEEPETPAEEGDGDGDGDGGEAGGGGGSGGLLAALRKNKNKKAKKGKPVNDFVGGEDASQEANGDADFSAKQPEEGTFDDEEDVFAGAGKKVKKGGAKGGAFAAPAAEKSQDDKEDGDMRVKSKKEKEKEKKEREKQRKREQVCFMALGFDDLLFGR